MAHSAGLIVALVIAFAAVVSAHPDERFLRMWNAAQLHKPAALSSVARIAPESEPGTPLVVRGVVLDPAGLAAPNVEVFAYHTDRTGLYAAEGTGEPWHLKGWAVTDEHGRFEFRTIRPAPYPNRDIPAHIHATVSTHCCGHQFTDLMFEDDPLATNAYRERFAAAGEHGLYGKVTRNPDGSESVSYTIRIREHGNF